MKIIISIIFSALLGAALLGGTLEMTPLKLENTTLFEKAEPCTLRIKVCYLISGFPSFKKDPCRGLGLRCLEWDKCEKISQFNPNDAQDGKTQVLFENISSQEMKITFHTNEKGDSGFTVDKPTLLPKIIASGFGYRSILVSPGTYPTKVNSDKSLSTILKIKTD
jgi:hypothetical protein